MRMRTTSLVAVALLFAGYTLVNVCVTSAQTNAADSARAYKIGIVEVQAVMDGYGKRKTEVGKLEQEAEKSNKEIEALQNSFQKELDQYKQDQANLSDTDRLERQEGLDRQKFALEMEIRQREASLERKKLSVKKMLLDDIVKAVSQVGSEENYHLILEADAETRTGVLFYSTTLNMTQKVIDRVNKQK